MKSEKWIRDHLPALLESKLIQFPPQSLKRICTMLLPGSKITIHISFGVTSRVSVTYLPDEQHKRVRSYITSDIFNMSLSELISEAEKQKDYDNL